MRRVIIESPYAGDVDKNLRYVREIVESVRNDERMALSELTVDEYSRNDSFMRESVEALAFWLSREICLLGADESKLRRACRAVLLFHAGGPWTRERANEWLDLTGQSEATTKGLCDFVREALGDVK